MATLAQAQQGNAKKQLLLVAGWYESPPQFEFGANGELAGFGADLTRLLARELDLPLEFRRANSKLKEIEAFAIGKTNIIPGIPSRLMLLETDIHSEPVGRSRRRLIVRADEQENITLDNMPAPTVGYLAADEELVSEVIPSQLSRVSFDTPDAGRMALLTREIDLWFATEEVLNGWAYNAGIDHLFVPFGDPYLEDVRVVGLHPSRAHLLEPINEAIDRLEDSGELLALRQRYKMQLHEPAPKVLSVGVAHFPPYQYVEEDGSFSGFAVDVFRDLAERTGLEFQMHEIAEENLLHGSDSAGHDAITLWGDLGNRHHRFDFTLPIKDMRHSLFVRAADADKVATLGDLTGRRVGVVSNTPGQMVAEANDELTLVTVNSQKQLLSLLTESRVDAVLTEALSFSERLATLDSPAGIESVGKPVFISRGAIALRFGLGEIRERLNAAIPTYMLSEEFGALQLELNGQPSFWNKDRQRMAFAAAALASMLLLVLGVVSLMNLRARRQAEKLTAQTLDVTGRLSAVMNATRSAIVGFNAAGQIAFANPSAQRMLGVEGNIVPYAWPDNVSFSDDTGKPLLIPFMGTEQHAIPGKELQGKLALMKSPERSERLYVRLSSSVPGAELSPDIKYVLVIEDATEQERHREQAERSSRLSAIGQLTGGIAHDFNNLLAVILGHLELIRDEQSKTEITRLADIAISSTLHGADLTRDMLAFARKSSLSPEVLDLNSVVVETKNWIGRTLPESVIVETSLLAGLWKVFADRSSTQSALLNLILNARDAMADSGCLTIETSNCRIDEIYIDSRGEELEPGRYVMLAVSDRGHGISVEQLGHIFEPFYTTKPLGHGVGLGLSSIMGFMRQSGGTVQVYSELGQGTTFKLYFPATQERAPAESNADSVELIPGTGHRVLLAEDEDAVREVLTISLTHAGYHVTAMTSGDDAFVRFKKDPSFDLLLTDIVMPGELQGTDLARALRTIRPELPVVFMSGYANEATVHGNGLRPEDIRLMKPVQRADLLAAMGKAIGLNKN